MWDLEWDLEVRDYDGLDSKNQKYHNNRSREIRTLLLSAIRT